MGLLGRKPKVNIEDCCKEFYDSAVFHATVGDIDVWSAYLETVKESVTEAALSFSAIDPNVLWQEMTALRMEVFALAFSEKAKREELAIQQSFFTKRYLEEIGRLDIWDIMGDYNLAVSRSAVMLADGQEMSEDEKVWIDKPRFDMFVKWCEANIGDPNSATEKDDELAKCVARVANRIGADIWRADSIAAKRLSARLADRLGCDINIGAEALFRLAATIFGFYTGAEEYLKSVSLQS